jgi:hypothetical protein
MTTNPHEDKQAVRAELVAARAEFHRLLDALADADWRRHSHNPGWTNGEILFHMALGFFMLPLLVPQMRLFGRLPRSVTRTFAAALNLATGPFNWVNGLGPRLGGRLLRRRALGTLYDWALARTLRMVDALPDDAWRRGMEYPHRWDALFQPYMTVVDLLRYPIVHMRVHAHQIAARTTETARP